VERSWTTGAIRARQNDVRVEGIRQVHKLDADSGRRIGRDNRLDLRT